MIGRGQANVFIPGSPPLSMYDAQIDAAPMLGPSWLVVDDSSNGELVAAAAAGDQKAWDALVDRFTSLLWNIARQYRLSPADAADVVQTTWLRLVENLDRIAEPDRVPRPGEP